MSDNVKEVVMAIIALISAVVTPLVVVIATKMQNKKIDTIETKLDENHKQQNGNLTKLLETTSQLATAKEKAKNKEENKK